MGQLVFQANSGGQTNLVGQNTASTFNLNIPLANGTLVSTGDTGTVTNTMISGPISIANGGTNSTATATAGGVGYGTGTAHAYTAAGTSGQVLTSSGSGAPTWTTPSSGGVTSFSAGTTGLTPNTGTTGAVTLAGTLAIANGGTNSTATPTAGGVVYGNGSAHAITAAGTSGQVLTSAGAGTPTWSTPSAGAMTLISTQTASGTSSIAFTGLSGYDKYLIILENITLSSNDKVGFVFGTGSGPTYVTSNYTYVGFETYTGSTTVAQFKSTSASQFLITANQLSTTNPGGYGFVYIYGFTSSNYIAFNSVISYNSGTYYAQDCLGGIQTTNTTNGTAIKFITQSGYNITGGTFSLYGISS